MRKLVKYHRAPGDSSAACGQLAGDPRFPHYRRWPGARAKLSRDLGVRTRQVSLSAWGSFDGMWMTCRGSPDLHTTAGRQGCARGCPQEPWRARSGRGPDRADRIVCRVECQKVLCGPTPERNHPSRKQQTRSDAANPPHGSVPWRLTDIATWTPDRPRGHAPPARKAPAMSARPHSPLATCPSHTRPPGPGQSMWTTNAGVRRHPGHHEVDRRTDRRSTQRQSTQRCAKGSHRRCFPACAEQAERLSRAGCCSAIGRRWTDRLWRTGPGG